MNARNASLHHALGLALVRQKRLDAAVGELRRAATLAPSVLGYAERLVAVAPEDARARELLAELRRPRP